MLKQLKHLLLITSVCLISACGFKFQNGGLIPQELQTLTLESSDPYSEMTIVLRKQLQMNNVNLVDSQQTIPVLRLNKITMDDKVASIFKRGREAEKVLILEVEAMVKLPNYASFPISAKVNRTFFDNSRAALAKSAEKEVIWHDMREQAARQLITKMVALQHQIQTK
ncbi:putative lipopolysccharide assembly LptE protein [Pasteurella canis]|uniref:LPS-assembly lipoprotein LptE n=1 Tax=Pasteurella canis TaxID=753 RepID=A0A379EY49_9PAST|nr:LPS assembly lipoprotein LptE [Pasteurella canis]SUC11113.1 putative lipopolysccharide assembly LptE protein [Pasteurella canis]